MDHPGFDFAMYVLRRLAACVALLVLISFAVFSVLYLAPGNPIEILLGTNSRTPETVRLLSERYHLDKSFLTQYWLWAKDALQFHFGDSVQTTLPVTDQIKARLPVSLFLGIYAFILTMLIGIALGVGAALKRGRAADLGIVTAGVVGLSTPVFVSGVLLLYVFGVELKWFPVFGHGEGFVDRLWHLTLPAFALSSVVAAIVMQNTRAALMGVLDQDYVVFARARGLSPTRILLGYALRNALIPVVTIGGIILAYTIVGAVVVEEVFSLSGIGDLLVQAARVKDIPVVQGVTLVVAVVILGANLLADLTYVAVDPRVRLGRRAV